MLLCVPAAAEASPNPKKLAKQITTAPDLKSAVGATQKALVAGGVGVVSNGKVVKRAKRPAPIAASGMEVLNLGVEAWHKKTGGRMTLRDLAADLRKARFPFKKPRKAATALRKFLKVWVRSAQRHKGDPSSFNARFLAAMAKRQGRPVNLAKGNYDPKFLRFTQLEVELFVAGLERGPKRLWKGSKRGRNSASASDDSPCSDYRKFQKEQLKELFGEKVANDLDAVLDYGFGMIGGEISGPVMENAVAQAIEGGILAYRGPTRPGQRAKGLSSKLAKRAMTALNLLQKIQKLATLYGSVEILVVPQAPVVHQDHNGNKVPVWFAAAAGLNGEGQQQYEELLKARAQESGAYKSLKDCLKLLGLPSLTDANDIADELEKWRVHWSFYYLNSHAEANVKNNVWDGGKQFTHKLTKVSDTYAKTRPAYVNIRPEGPNDRAGCQEVIRRTYVTAEAELDMSKPPDLGTVIDVISGNVAGVAIQAAEQMFLQSVTPSGETTMIIEYHVPDKQTARASQVCRPSPKSWSGTASGSMTDGNGRVQTWSVSLTMPLDPDFDGSDGFAWYHKTDGSSEGTATWQLSGTDSSGCSWQGSGQMAVKAEVSLTEYEGVAPAYELRVNKSGFGGQATQTCPGQQPGQDYWEPLLFADGEMCNPGPLAYNGETKLSGEAHYTAGDSQDSQIDCSWTLNAGY